MRYTVSDKVRERIEKTKTGSNKQCLFCKKEFYVPFWRTLDKTRGKFCSKDCHNLWKKLQPKSDGNVENECPTCGKVFYSFPSDNRKYCCWKCQLKKPGPLTGKKFSEEHKNKIAKANSGEKNHLWRGGISFTPYTMDWTATLRRAIRERDNYTCQSCGAEQGDKAHAVHHIDYDKTNCNPTNLITLCNSCHTKTNISKRESWTGLLRQKVSGYGE